MLHKYIDVYNMTIQYNNNIHVVQKKCIDDQLLFWYIAVPNTLM